MWTFLFFATLCFGLVQSANMPQFPPQLINATTESLQKLGCDIDIRFQPEGLKVNILCELEEVMTWLDTWFKPILIVMIIVTILIATFLVLCCIRMSKLNLDCCGCTKRLGWKSKGREEDSFDSHHNMLPLVTTPKDIST